MEGDQKWFTDPAG